MAGLEREYPDLMLLLMMLGAERDDVTLGLTPSSSRLHVRGLSRPLITATHDAREPSSEVCSRSELLLVTPSSALAVPALDASTPPPAEH